MKKTPLQQYIALAKEGTKASIDKVMRHLNKNMTIAQSKFIDYALGQVQSEEGVAVMEHYLLHGTQIQHFVFCKARRIPFDPKSV